MLVIFMTENQVITSLVFYFLFFTDGNHQSLCIVLFLPALIGALAGGGCDAGCLRAVTQSNGGICVSGLQ